MYSLPDLPFAYDALEPYISKEQLSVHHAKHHQAYVTSANAVFEKLEKARTQNQDLDQKAALKELSFNVGGHALHSLFWENLAPASSAAKKPEGFLLEILEAEFGSFERFKKEFSQAASSVEGSGWAALVLDKISGRLLLSQIEKHNTNVYPGAGIALVLDMFEHAYYIDYKNDKKAYIEAFWNIINWEMVAKRVNSIVKT